MIINITVYIATIDVVLFNTSAHYSRIEMILKITIIKISRITFMFVLISMAVNNVIYDAKRNEFIFSYFKQTVINVDIFI